MRRILLLPLLWVACTGGATTPRAPDRPVTVVAPAASAASSDDPELPGPLDPEDYLRDDYAARFKQRTQLARMGRVRLAPELAPLKDASSFEHKAEVYSNRRVKVVAEAGARLVRVISDNQEIRMLFWVERDDLIEVITDRVKLKVPAAGAPDSYVALLPGLPVNVTQRGEQRSSLEFADSYVSVSGSAPSAAIGHIYQISEVEELKVDFVVGNGALLLDRPGGKPLARFTSGVGLRGLDSERNGYRRVMYRAPRDHADDYQRGGVELVGYVQSPAKPEPGELGKISGMGFGGGWGGSHTITLEPGTRFFDAPDGRLVGVVVKSTLAYEHGRENGWRKLYVGTEFGFFVLDSPVPPDQPGEDEEEHGW